MNDTSRQTGPVDVAPAGHPTSPARLIACMQELIHELGRRNSELQHEVEKRRAMTRKLSRELHQGDLFPMMMNPGRDNLVVSIGSHAVMQMPDERTVILPAGPVASNGHGANGSPAVRGEGHIVLHRWKPLPRSERLLAVYAEQTTRQQARLLKLAREVLCLQFAETLLRNRGDLGEHPGIVVLGRDGTIRLFNERAAELLGLPVTELPGRPFLRCVAAEERRWLNELLRSDSDGLQIMEFWTSDGAASAPPVKSFLAPLRTGTRRTGHVVALTELNDQEQRMEELAKKEKIYRRFFEEDVTGDYSCTPDGRLITCNAAFARMFGFGSVEEAMNCNLRQLHVDGEAADFFMENLRKHRRLTHFESVMRRVDGRHIHVIRNVVGRFGADGELIEIIGYIFDNTERKQLENRVRQSQKMETVGRLAGGIAHDFNNLLLAIQGYSSLLADHVPMDSEGRDALEQIQRATDRAAALTRQLLAFSRRQVMQPRTFNINQAIGDLSSLLQRMLGEDIELVAQLDPELGSVHADIAQFEQVLVHLAANARDAMPRGGRLTLTTRNIRLQDMWFSFHDGPPPGDYVELAVQDNGVGMTDEVKAHLFEPFFTTKEQGKGQGLGLPTVYGIIKQSGGEIQAYSALGEGTTFKIYLPRRGAATAEPARPADRDASSSVTVLVVEDEPAVRQLIVKILARKGFQVVEAESGAGALAMMAQHDGPVQLMLTDLIMPQMSGRELRDRLIQDFPDLKVIFMSGYTEDAVLKNGVMQQKVNFLQKPFSPDVLLAKVSEVLGRETAGGA